MAAAAGFEPTNLGSEPSVLPLDYAAVFILTCGSLSTLLTWRRFYQQMFLFVNGSLDKGNIGCSICGQNGHRFYVLIEEQEVYRSTRLCFRTIHIHTVKGFLG